MEVLIQRFGKHEFSPFSQWNQSSHFADFNIKDAFTTQTTFLRAISWVNSVSNFARSSIVLAVLLALSVVVFGIQLLTRSRGETVPRTKASSVKWPYELASQTARIASVVFIALAVVKGQLVPFQLALVSYALLLGLVRLFRGLHCRHIALHHVNFVLSAQLLLLVLGHLLPCIQASSSCHQPVSVAGAVISLTAAFVIAVNTPREWAPPKVEFEGLAIERAVDGNEKPAAEETCSWLNYYCTYNWLTPIVWKGTKGELDMSSVPRLAWYDEPLYLLWKVQNARSIAGKTLWTTIRFQRQELALMCFWISIGFTVENVAPYGMFRLLEYLADPLDATYHPWVWLFLLFVGPIARSLTFQQYVFTSTRLLVRIKSAMTQELYVKALSTMEMEDDPFTPKDKAPAAENDGKKAVKTTSAGRLANLMAADVDAIYRARDMVQVIAGVPIGTAISLVGLYAMLGWASIVGSIVLIIGAPLSVWLGQLMYKYQGRVRKAQDARISLVTEYLTSIRAIKYFAWEKPITEKIVDSRAAEQKQLWSVTVLSALLSQVTQIFPYLALLVMFGLHVGVEKKDLDASTAFTAILLVKNIRRNIMQASFFGRNFTGALVSIDRLDKYFDNAVPLREYPIGPLRIEKAAFRRTKKAIFRLEDISIDFVEGGLNVVSGQSGSGKSTLLYGILGETYMEEGSLTKPEDIAFASQSAWLQNDTIKANILFGSTFEQARYERILSACCLHPDLRELAYGDRTIVGENGTSLSGGQKARVAMARALYSKAPVLLLDDIFSALDAKTAADVWKHCFCSDLLKGRTTVLVTQVPWISEQGDLSVVLDEGRVKSCEPNIGVVRTPVTIAEVLGGNADDGEGDETQVESDPEGEPEPELQANGDALNDVTKVAQEEAPRDIVNQEMKASGKAGRLTMFAYMGYFGNPSFAVVCVFSMFMGNVLWLLGSYWLSIWVEAYDERPPPPGGVNAAYYMSIFALITFLEIGSYAVITLLFEWGAWRAARRLHNDFIRAIMNVSLSWFKIVPIGRVVNRFSGDMASIDGSLSNMLRASMDAFMMLFFRIFAVSTIMPIFMVPALFACLFGVIVGEMYTRTAVVLKRLTSSAQSPVFSLFGDTLLGLPVVRARAGMAKAFSEELAAKLRVWSASAETNYNCNRWVAVRVDFVTAIVSLAAGVIAVSQSGKVAAGLVGFSLSNANGLSQTILQLVRAMNDLEVEMQSFHRVKEYVKLEPEENLDETYPEEGEYADDATQVIPKNWPRTGEIEFRNVTIRYDPDGPNILTDVNLKFKAGQRVAVVGRTGSGKSTLVLSLLRFTHIVTGQILYDGIDITKIPRHRLRECLTIIPQEAVLFNGTVGSNLDPSSTIPRAVLEKALDNCRGIASFSDNTPGPSAPDTPLLTTEPQNAISSSSSATQYETTTNQGNAKTGIQLDTEVDARGENFSHGQRQVLSLCRALIRGSKLMLLDEATASMDYETDKGIQQVLREDLEEAGGDRTLVTIAHRLRTIIDYDSVVVMSAGHVVEYGTPKDLYEAKGQFYDMIYHSGELEDLQEFLQS